MEIKKKLLILEDDRISCIMYQAHFGDFYEVDVVHNAKDFLQYFKENKPDAGLIDVNIKDPEYTGIDLVKMVKSSQPELTTDFILMTAYSKSELKIPDEFCDYHQKPIELERLTAQIKSIIDK
ncbi:MAG: response regulator [Cyclobacteriaceae bacterium]